MTVCSMRTEKAIRGIQLMKQIVVSCEVDNGRTNAQDDLNNASNPDGSAVNVSIGVTIGNGE